MRLYTRRPDAAGGKESVIRHLDVTLPAVTFGLNEEDTSQRAAADSECGDCRE